MVRTATGSDVSDSCSCRVVPDAERRDGRCAALPPASDRSTWPAAPGRRPDTANRGPISPATPERLGWFLARFDVKRKTAVPVNPVTFSSKRVLAAFLGWFQGQNLRIRSSTAL